MTVHLQPDEEMLAQRLAQEQRELNVVSEAHAEIFLIAASVSPKDQIAECKNSGRKAGRGFGGEFKIGGSRAPEEG